MIPPPLPSREEPLSTFSAADQPGTHAGGIPHRYPIGGVDRTLSVLELLAECHELRLAQVRDHLGVGQSTAHRLMAMLLHRGFAQQDPATRIYRAGSRLHDLSEVAAGVDDLRRAAHPMLEWLSDESGETTHLGIMSELNVRYVDVVETAAALRVSARVGRLTPAHATSMGKAMLATFDAGQLRRMYGDASLATPTERTVDNFEALLAEVSRTRRRGWARNRQEMELGVCSVGVSIVDARLGLLGGLSIATPHVRSTIQLERRHAGLLQMGRDRLLVTLADR